MYAEFRSAGNRFADRSASLGSAWSFAPFPLLRELVIDLPAAADPGRMAGLPEAADGCEPVEFSPKAVEGWSLADPAPEAVEPCTIGDAPFGLADGAPFGPAEPGRMAVAGPVAVDPCAVDDRAPGLADPFAIDDPAPGLDDPGRVVDRSGSVDAGASADPGVRVDFRESVGVEVELELFSEVLVDRSVLLFCFCSAVMGFVTAMGGLPECCRMRCQVTPTPTSRRIAGA